MEKAKLVLVIGLILSIAAVSIAEAQIDWWTPYYSPNLECTYELMNVTNMTVCSNGSITLTDGGWIFTTNNGDINLQPDGTGDVVVYGNLNLTQNLTMNGTLNMTKHNITNVSWLFVNNITGDPVGIDVDTYMFENLYVTENLTVDTDTMRVDSLNNRVGIGTTTPQNPLNVVGDINGTDDLDITDDTNIGGDADIAGNLTVNINTLFVDSLNNRVGIVATNPNVELDVNGTTRLGDSITNYASFATDGELSLVGTARVKRTDWIGAEGLKGPGTKPATLVEHGIGQAFEFSDATDDTITAKIRVPNDMDTSVQPLLHIGWSAPVPDPGDETKNASWQAELLWSAENDPMNASADNMLIGNFTASTTADGLVVAEFQMTNLSATDTCVTLRIKRRADLADDTINGENVYLHGVCLVYTSNKLGEAT